MRLAWLGSMVVLAVGCGDAGGAQAQLALANGGTGTTKPVLGESQAVSSVPAELGVKLIAAYLAEDIDPQNQNNVGNTSMFYLNDECTTDIMHCDISAGTAEDGQPMSHIVNSFFNFARTTNEVNAELNAQLRSVPVGTYRYVRVEFCKYNAGGTPNFTWRELGGSASHSFVRNGCVVNSVAFSPPLEVTLSDTVVVTLTYDLTTAVQTGSDAAGDDCVGTGASRVCVRVPTFVPSAAIK